MPGPGPRMGDRMGTRHGSDLQVPNTEALAKYQASVLTAVSEASLFPRPVPVTESVIKLLLTGPPPLHCPKNQH